MIRKASLPLALLAALSLALVSAAGASAHIPRFKNHKIAPGTSIGGLKVGMTMKQARKAWGKSDEEKLIAECQQRIDAAVERYLASTPRPPESMFDHLYAELPQVYVAQRDELKGVPDA